MSWSFISVYSTEVQSTADDPTQITAGLPDTYAEGDLLLLFITCNSAGAGGDPTITGPSGYTLLADDSAATATWESCWLYGKIAGASESAPAFSLTNNARTVCHMAAFRDSNGVTTLGSIVHANSETSVANNTAATLTYPALTVSQDNCLIIMGGYKQKAVDEETQCDVPTNFTELGDRRPNFATSLVSVWDYWIQTTKTNISSGTYTLSPWTEGANKREGAIAVALLSTAGSSTPKGRMLLLGVG